MALPLLRVTTSRGTKISGDCGAEHPPVLKAALLSASALQETYLLTPLFLSTPVSNMYPKSTILSFQQQAAPKWPHSAVMERHEASFPIPIQASHGHPGVPAPSSIFKAISPKALSPLLSACVLTFISLFKFDPPTCLLRSSWRSHAGSGHLPRLYPTRTLEGGTRSISAGGKVSARVG